MCDTPKHSAGVSIEVETREIIRTSEQDEPTATKVRVALFLHNRLSVCSSAAVEMRVSMFAPYKTAKFSSTSMLVMTRLPLGCLSLISDVVCKNPLGHAVRCGWVILTRHT